MARIACSKASHSSTGSGLGERLISPPSDQANSDGVGLSISAAE